MYELAQKELYKLKSNKFHWHSVTSFWSYNRWWCKIITTVILSYQRKQQVDQQRCLPVRKELMMWAGGRCPSDIWTCLWPAGCCNAAPGVCENNDTCVTITVNLVYHCTILSRPVLDGL